MSELSSKSDDRQVDTLIYTMGDKADDILISFGLSNDNRSIYYRSTYIAWPNTVCMEICTMK